ncbi:TPA: hypothetical protein ACSTQ4_000076 [Pseudomonas aeruginosa]
MLLSVDGLNGRPVNSSHKDSAANQVQAISTRTAGTLPPIQDIFFAIQVKLGTQHCHDWLANACAIWLKNSISGKLKSQDHSVLALIFKRLCIVFSQLKTTGDVAARTQFAIKNLLGIRIFWLIGSYHDDGTNHQLSGLPG